MCIILNIIPNVYWVYNNPNKVLQKNEYNIELQRYCETFNIKTMLDLDEKLSFWHNSRQYINEIKVEMEKNEFSKFILRSDEIPKLELENAKIDVISPAIKRGKFRWKGFYNNNIINFLMNDFDFSHKVINGKIPFSNRYSIEVDMTQERKIDQDGNIVVTNSVVSKVNASIEGENRIEY